MPHVQTVKWTRFEKEFSFGPIYAVTPFKFCTSVAVVVVVVAVVRLLVMVVLFRLFVMAVVIVMVVMIAALFSWYIPGLCNIGPGYEQSCLESINGSNPIVTGYTELLRQVFVDRGRECDYFTVMRHPVDRLVSAFFYCPDRDPQKRPKKWWVIFECFAKEHTVSVPSCLGSYLIFYVRRRSIRWDCAKYSIRSRGTVEGAFPYSLCLGCTPRLPPPDAAAPVRAWSRRPLALGKQRKSYGINRSIFNVSFSLWP